MISTIFALLITPPKPSLFTKYHRNRALDSHFLTNQNKDRSPTFTLRVTPISSIYNKTLPLNFLTNSLTFFVREYILYYKLARYRKWECLCTGFWKCDKVKNQIWFCHDIFSDKSVCGERSRVRKRKNSPMGYHFLEIGCFYWWFFRGGVLWFEGLE